MSVTYYTVDDLRPGRSGWGVKHFSALNDAISHYRSLPMDGARVLGMADDAHAYELIRCVRLFPGDAQGEDVLAADYRRAGSPFPSTRSRGKNCGRPFSGRAMRKTMIPPFALFL